MTYEKAEFILQQLMAEGVRFLVAREGKAVITDQPKNNDVVVGETSGSPSSHNLLTCCKK